ncbi:MAG TPA: hypothetical protein VGA95_14125 [Thermodesulfobacteriota bacterium]
MNEPKLIAAILHRGSFPRTVIGNPLCLSSYFDALSIDSTVAISFFIEELGSFDGKKKKEKKD